MMETHLLIVFFAFFVATCCGDQAHVDEFSDQNRVLRYSYRKKFRPSFHISAPVGWLNAPSAFVLYKQLYHIFYQYYPYNGGWGPMRWGHVVSKDLVDWFYSSPALIPKERYEINGCFSGSAVVHNEYLVTFFTGVRIMNNSTTRTQNIAVSTDGISFQKHLHNPVIKRSPNDARNPKVWKFRNSWYMILASTSLDKKPQIILYTSTDLFTWRYNGTVLESLGDMGNIWEHPDFFEINGQYVLLFTAHGMTPKYHRFRNLYQTGYVIGSFNYLTGKFEDVEISSMTFNELDYGHDFYGAHTVQALDGRRLLIGWLGMWQSDFEELRDGWAGMLTIIREVTVDKDDRIMLQPLRELNELRVELLESAYYQPGESFKAESKHFEMLINGSNVIHDLGLVFEWGGGSQFSIHYDATRGLVTIDRGGTDGIRKASWMPDKQIFWRLFVDSSAIEIFCGEGEVVFSSRIYPKKSLIVTVEGGQQVHVLQHRLRRNIAYGEHLREHMKEMHEMSVDNPPNDLNAFCPLKV